MDNKDQPLSGIKILDLSRLLPGPYASMLLRQLGAEVIKVEDTGLGDYMRSFRPAAYTLLNAGNQSVALNLKTDEGRALLRTLLADADVLLESFRPGVMERLGMGYDVLKSDFPQLVFCSISGFGQTGPYRDWPGHDANYMGVAGALDNGLKTGETNPLPVADESSALFAALSIVSAVYRCQKTGKGGRIDVSMTDSAAAIALPMRAAQVGASDEKGQTAQAHTMPGYGAYQCEDDKWLTLGAIEPQFWKSLCEVIGHEDWLTQNPDPRESNPERTHADIKKALRTKRRDDWIHQFEQADVPAAPLNQTRDILDDPQIQADHRFFRDPNGLQMRYPVLMSFNENTPSNTQAPVQGQHTLEVLRRAGIDDETLQNALQSGVIKMSEANTN
ncbi:MAG TPA: hypothetical protein DCZ12_12500 [Gammaproteobacteria bacterium]|nr:hypothetical protein [Gammaproteobacteria bacterium]